MTGAAAIGGASIVLGLVVLGLKTLAWALTGSAALFSDAAESVVNVATAVMALLALRIAARPATPSIPTATRRRRCSPPWSRA